MQAQVFQQTNSIVYGRRPNAGQNRTVPEKKFSASGQHNPYRRLMMHVICQALRDAESVDEALREDAIIFLCGERGLYYMELVGYGHLFEKTLKQFKDEFERIQEKHRKLKIKRQEEMRLAREAANKEAEAAAKKESEARQAAAKEEAVKSAARKAVQEAISLLMKQSSKEHQGASPSFIVTQLNIPAQQAFSL